MRRGCAYVLVCCCAHALMPQPVVNNESRERTAHTLPRMVCIRVSVYEKPHSRNANSPAAAAHSWCSTALNAASCDTFLRPRLCSAIGLYSLSERSVSE